MPFSLEKTAFTSVIRDIPLLEMLEVRLGFSRAFS